MKKITSIYILFTLAVALGLAPLSVCAAEDDYTAQMEERKTLPIQSNDIDNWPEGPVVGAESAIVMEMNTHTILYAKNIHEELYPASTTKILTCLLASKYCNLSDTVTFSKEAVESVPSDGSNMGMDIGESITLEQAMYGVLVASANEAASAVGEHVATTLGREASEFPDIMNEYAKELGCLNSHFANANGLFDENHYTSAYDLALIGCEFFANDILCTMSSTTSYHIATTDTQPDDMWLGTKNQLYEGKEYEYEYLLGSKTGYLDQARQTLVTGAEKDGMRLVCVVLMEETPYQYEDTISLLNYGFSNFSLVSVEDNETDYVMENTGIFENITPTLSLSSEDYVVLPKSAAFEDCDSSISYENGEAIINYTYSGISVGSCKLLYTPTESIVDNFNTGMNEAFSQVVNADGEKIYYINVVRVILIIAIVSGILIFIRFVINTIGSYQFQTNSRSLFQRVKRGREDSKARRNSRNKRRELARLKRQKKKAYKKRRDR